MLSNKKTYKAKILSYELLQYYFLNTIPSFWIHVRFWCLSTNIIWDSCSTKPAS